MFVVWTMFVVFTVLAVFKHKVELDPEFLSNIRYLSSFVCKPRQLQISIIDISTRTEDYKTIKITTVMISGSQKKHKSFSYFYDWVVVAH